MRVPPYVQFEHMETSLIEQPTRHAVKEISDCHEIKYMTNYPNTTLICADLNTCRTPLNKVN